MVEIVCRWHGDRLEPVGKSQVFCNENFVIGMMYRFEPIFPRDRNMNAARFAALGEAFKQLPHDYDGVFSNFDHFRKWLLVREGYCTVRELIMADAEEAARQLPFLQTVWEDNPRDKDFCFVEVQGRFIRITHPQSMSEKSMRPSEFREATSKMLERAADMIGISVDQLRSNTGRSA